MKPDHKKGKEYREAKAEELLKEKTSIVEKCSPCSLHDQEYCNTYLWPESRWRLGNCSMATHLVSREVKDQDKKRVGQQKQNRG